MGGVATKWLDIHSLCASFLPLLGKKARIENIYYFSALAHHLSAVDPGKVLRHETYIKCLESKGIIKVLGRFKGKTIRCGACGARLNRNEEKETDVAIATRLLEILITESSDTVLLVTGDTDLAPAVRTARTLFPSKKIGFLFPYRRKNRELANLAELSFQIKKKKYALHQFPDPFMMPDGKIIKKPAAW